MKVSNCYQCNIQNIQSLRKPTTNKPSKYVTAAARALTYLHKRVHELKNDKNKRVFIPFFIGCGALAVVAGTVSTATIFIFILPTASVLTSIAVGLGCGNLLSLGLLSISFGSFEFFLKSPSYKIINGIKEPTVNWEKRFKDHHHVDLSKQRIYNKDICLIAETTHKNGAFGSLKKYSTLETKYPLVFAEVSNTEELVKLAEKARSFGGCIKLLIIRGHGNYTSLQLGEKRYLLENDLHRMKWLIQLNHLIDRDATIFLDSCLTGDHQKGRCYAEFVSQMFPCRTIIASKVAFSDSNLKVTSTFPLDVSIKLSPNGNEESVIFRNGVVIRG